MQEFGKIDWRSLQRYTSSQAVKDFDKFLDALPVNAGIHALVAAGIAWMIAGGAVLFTATEVEHVSSLRKELLEVEALSPPIPVLKYEPVKKTELEELGKKVEKMYSSVSLASTGDGNIAIKAADTDYFPQFLAAISIVQNAGKSWRVQTDSMCVGRDCKSGAVSINLKVDTVRIGDPEKNEDKKKSKD